MNKVKFVWIDETDSKNKAPNWYKKPVWKATAYVAADAYYNLMDRCEQLEAQLAETKNLAHNKE